MARWAPDAALRLETAATTLFERDGYDATTVPQIAAAAGLTTRTFFRHFADKQEVLFLRDREFPSVMDAALAEIPAGGTASDIVLAGLRTAGAEMEQWREAIRRRRRIVEAEPRLRERELLKNAHLAAAIRTALGQRGIGDADASLCAGIAVVVLVTALEQWLAIEDSTLTETLDRTWNSLHRVVRA